MIARTLKKVTNTRKIKETFAKIEAWANQNSIVFDQAKFVAIYFFWKKYFPKPEIVLLTSTANMEKVPQILKPVMKKDSICWLGVCFDFCLLFSDYATKMARKGQKTAASLVMLVETTRRVEAIMIRKAVHACILLILIYKTPAL